MPESGGGRRVWQPWVLLLAGLIATALAALYLKSDADGDAKREFDFICHEIQNKIVDRLKAHEQILRSGAAFFDHSGGVTRQDWRRFTELQNVQQQLPGIQGIGFALMIPTQKLAQHVQEIRAEGFPDYQVRPEGEREIYSSIIYLEPFSGRNLRAFGYDMLSETVRRTAMERARDLNTAALSGKVTLVQETEEDVQAGTLMYLPVYRQGVPHATVAQHRDALLGWVYSPYRMNDLMQGILGGWELAGKKRIHLKIFDGDQISSETMLYDSQSGGKRQGETESRLTLQIGIVSAGRPWTLRFTRAGDESSAMDYGKVWLVVFGGVSVSILLSGLFFSMLNTRSQAMKMAQRLTTELRESEGRYRSLLKDMLEGFAYCRMVFDDQGRPVDFIYLTVNQAFEKLTGLRDVVGKPVTAVIPMIKKVNPELFEIYGRVVKTGTPEKFEINFKPLARWLSVSVTKTGEGCFSAIFEDITERKQMEESLRRSEERLKLALSGGDLGTWDWHVPSGAVIFNERWATMLGYTLAEIKPHVRAWETLIHPDDMPMVAAVLDAHLEQKTDFYEVEHRLRHKSGEWIWVLDKGRVIERDAQGKALRMCGTHLEITERKQAESKAIGLAQRNQVLLQTGSDGLHVLDEQGNVVEANDMFCRMLGYSREEMLRLNVAAWDKQWPSAELPTKIRHFIDHPGLFETRHQTKDGSIREVEISGRGVTLENRRYLYASARDITERKRMEAALIQSEEKFRVIFENEIYAICIFDLQTLRLLDVNDAYACLYGYHREEILSGMTIHNFSAEPQVSDAATAEAIREGTIFIPLRYHRKRDGTVFPVEIVGGPYHWQDKQVMFALIHDISERKRAQAEKETLEAQNRQLHKSESLGRMAGAIAHHFNNKLAAVLMNLNFAMEGQPNNEELAEALKSTHEAATVSTLMLTYLGQTYGKRVSFELAESCRDQMPILRASLPLNVTLETDFPTPGPSIHADANQIQQVLSNLLINAEEAIGEGTGGIRLSVKTVAAADIPSTRRFPIDYQSQETNYACLEVADTGCGIADQDIEKLFDPFYSTKFTGRGLGLPVVLGIVRTHQGVITVETRLGEGSVFRVFLPVSGVTVPKKPVPVAQAPKIVGSGTVLVVDDEISVRNVMAKAFKRLGFNVLAAVDGTEAVEIFRAHQTKIRLVLCDLTMPRMNGWETLTALRQISPGIPVILSSGYSEVQALAGKHSELPQVFLSKPCTFEELRDTVARVLGKG